MDLTHRQPIITLAILRPPMPTHRSVHSIRLTDRAWSLDFL